MIRYVVCRQRVGIDVDRCKELYRVPEDQLDDALRNYVVALINQSEAAQQEAIVSSRRDRL